jgi:hypothetical protein
VVDQPGEASGERRQEYESVFQVKKTFRKTRKIVGTLQNSTE